MMAVARIKGLYYFSITSLFCHTPFHFIRTKIYRVVLRFILTLSAHSWEIFAIEQAGSVLHFFGVFMESGNDFFLPIEKVCTLEKVQIHTVQ